MIKILFYGYVEPEADNRFYLSTAVLVLKTHIEINYPELAKHLEWVVQQEKLSNDELISLCNKENPDVLATSNYIWNSARIMNQLEEIKNKINSNTKIVVGGPSISANIDSEFFQKYPFVDYAIYGPGENAFADIISSLFNKTKLIAFNTSNVAWFDKQKNKTVIADYKYVSIAKVSSYIFNKELFTTLVKNEQAKGYEVAIPFELTRGCPYACTFCDWNSGLSNKVSRRKNAYIEDIDLFQELGLKIIYLADANVGQYDEDVDMIAYFAKKNKEEDAQFRIEGNLSKLKKANNLKIFHHFAQANLITKTGLILAVQDINEEILKNVDRPDVTWAEHKKVITELLECYPDYFVKLQLIQGLPGQTVESWFNTLCEVSKERIVHLIFISEYLPTSPAAIDKKYQDTWNYEYSQSLRVNGRKKDNAYFRGNIPKSCASFTQKDFTVMTVMSQLFVQLQIIKCSLDNYSEFDTPAIAKDFLKTDMFKVLVEGLYNSWTNEDKFYYHNIQYAGFNSNEVYSACDIPSGLLNSNQVFWEFILTHPTTKNIRKDLYKLFKATQRGANEQVFDKRSKEAINTVGTYLFLKEFY